MQFLKIGNKKLEHYEGILIQADEGLHLQAMDLLKAHVSIPARVLDVGAGNGAFSLRMFDQGYVVEAIDLECERFEPRDAVPCRQIDLDSHDARTTFIGENQEVYDAVAALEVIEHLHDPWAFLGFCRAALKPGAILLLSTPNITSFPSRVLFLTRGRFHQFALADQEYGHISPLSAQELELMFRELHFEVLDKKPGGNLPLLWLKRDAKFCLNWTVGTLLYPLMKHDKDGWCLLYVLRKGAPHD